MKTRLFLMALASVALASCVSEDVSGVKQKEEKVTITFDSPVLYDNAESRAGFYGEIGSHQYVSGGTVYSYPREESFIIYAVAHEGTFGGWDVSEVFEFNGTSISWDQSVDGWAPKKTDGSYYYWPSGKLMTFAASSPADLGVTGAVRKYGANGLTITGFEVSNDASQQYDLLFSTRTCNKSSDDMTHSASYYSGIPIQFQHALSSIRFSVSNTSDATVVLKKISLYGAKYKGDFSEKLTEGTDKTKYDREGDDANVVPSWTLVAGALVEESNPYIAFEGNITFPENAQYVSALATNTDKYNHLLLLPQELENEVKIKVEYTVNGEDASKVVTLDALKDLNNEIVDSWEIGVRYTYRLVYSKESADKDKIYFAPSSDKWIEHDVIVVDLI